MFPPDQVELLQKTLPLFQKEGNNVALELYREVFKVDKSLRNLFSVDFLCPRISSSEKVETNQSDDEPLSNQARILSKTIVDFAANINGLESFQKTIDRICYKHVSRDIRPEHYAVVSAAFADAIKTVFGKRLSEKEQEAWKAAVGALAGVFIEREKKIRDEAKGRLGGWEGWRPFLVKKQEGLTSGAQKLTLEPKDGKPVCPAGNGQFSCARLPVEGYGTIHYNMQLCSTNHEQTVFDDARKGHSTSNPRPFLPFNSMSLSKNAGSMVSSISEDSQLGSNSPRANNSGTNLTYSAMVPARKSSPEEVGKYPGFETTLIISAEQVVCENALDGTAIDLSVPVGGGGCLDIDEQAGALKKPSSSLLRQAQSRNANPMLRTSLGQKPAMSSPLTGGARFNDMTKRKSSRLESSVLALSPTNISSPSATGSNFAPKGPL